MPRSWPHDAQLAVSLVVNVEEGSEASIARGDRGPEPVDELGVTLKKPVRNFGNESNYRYGIQAGAPRVLALLQANGLRATFTAAAMSLEQAPELVQGIVAGGHEVCSHGWRWVHQFEMNEDEERAFIAKALASITRTTGTRPLGWLSRYLHTERTRRLLIEAGFHYHMDDYSDDKPFWEVLDGKPILVMPYALDTNDMKLWTDPAFTPRHWLDYAVDTFDCLYRESAIAPRMMSLGLHLRIIGRPGRIAYLERFIQHVRAHDKAWVATRAEIAEAWRAYAPPPV